MDYKITVAAPENEEINGRVIRASTQTDVANWLSMLVRKCNDNKEVKTVSFTIDFDWKD